MLNKKLLQDAQQVVSAALADAGIQVVYDTETPYADLRNKVMHLRPLPEKVSKEMVLHLRADCDHETGHFLASDPDALESVKDPLIKLLTNSIEDGFVERVMTDRWFGCGENLRASNKALIDSQVAVDDDTEDHVRKLAITALHLLTFGMEKDEVVAWLGDRVVDDVEAVEDLLPRLRSISSTTESVELAREVDRRWWWTDPDAHRGDGGAEGIDTSGGDEAGGTGGDDDGDGEGDKEGESTDSSGKDDAASTSDADREYSEAEAAARKDLAERLGKDTLSARRKTLITEAPFVESRYFAKTDLDLIEEIKPLDKGDRVTEFLDSVRGVVPTLRRRLLMEFRGIGTKREFDKKRGDIDRESLHKVAVGNTRVFTRDTPHVVPGADVTLLVDASGSMLCGGGRGSRSRIYVAAQAACAFSQVLDLIGVPNEVLAFTSNEATGFDFFDKHRAAGGVYSRVRPLRHLIIKPEKAPFRTRKAHFAALAEFDRCAENVDGESVMWAARRLAARNRSGMAPIMIVFSDGEPASHPEDFSLLAWHLKDTVKRIEKAGINMIGVGIQSKSVQRYYKNHLVLSDVSDLVGTSYSILRSVLRSARRAG